MVVCAQLVVFGRVSRHREQRKEMLRRRNQGSSLACSPKREVHDSTMNGSPSTDDSFGTTHANVSKQNSEHHVWASSEDGSDNDGTTQTTDSETIL